VTEDAVTEASETSFDPAMVVVGLGLALGSARSREHAREVLVEAWELLSIALDSAASDALVRALLRAAIAALLAHQEAARALAWPIVDELRVALAALDDGVDADAREAATGDDQSAIALKIASWIESTPVDDARLDRSIAVLWDTLDPPRARKAALLIDVASRCARHGRGRVLLALAARGVDVRSTLAADPTLDDDARIAALSRFSQHRPRASLSWSEPASLVMARACADWSRFASHPRVLFFHYARHVGAAAWPAALEAMARWPLSVEVRNEWTRQRERTPSRVTARALDKGAWACGRCDGRSVRALRRWSDEDESTGAATTGEVEFQCAACGLRYWASWDEETLSTTDPEPEAWVVS
jgi:hypothetical protein